MLTISYFIKASNPHGGFSIYRIFLDVMSNFTAEFTILVEGLITIILQFLDQREGYFNLMVHVANIYYLDFGLMTPIGYNKAVLVLNFTLYCFLEIYDLWIIWYHI